MFRSFGVEGALTINATLLSWLYLSFTKMKKKGKHCGWTLYNKRNGIDNVHSFVGHQANNHLTPSMQICQFEKEEKHTDKKKNKNKHTPEIELRTISTLVIPFITFSINENIY